jgi:hypothetical protein
MTRGEPTKTIAQARAAGETRFTVHCGRVECGHRAEMTFDEIKLPDSTMFVHIPRLLKFRVHELRKPRREGDADLSAGSRPARPQGLRFTRSIAGAAFPISRRSAGTRRLHCLPTST